MARKDIDQKAAEARAPESRDPEESAGQRLRRYVAPRIRTLSLPALQASPPCNPVECPPQRFGCGPNICAPVMPPPNCNPNR